MENNFAAYDGPSFDGQGRVPVHRTGLFVRPLFSSPAQLQDMISSCRGYRSKLVRCLSTTTHTRLDGFQPHRSGGYFSVDSHGSKTLYLQTLVQKCARNLLLLEGKVCHGQIVGLGLQSDTFTSNMLVNVYCKCGLIEYARQVFDQMLERSSVSWNTMIGAYTQKGYAEEGLGLFMEMQKERSSISEFTVSSVLCACAAKCAILESKQLHAFAVKTSILSNVFVGTALLDVYSKCNLINEASVVFESMEEKSDVTWSSMVAGFVRNELYDEALMLYRQTQAEGVAQTKFTVSSVLSACAGLAALIEGKQVHAVLCKVGLDEDVYVSSSLIDMYAKCGSIVEAYHVFSYEGCKDLVLWNAIISGFSRHGGSLEVRILFEKMQQIGLRPNELTYVSVLSACAHKGLVEEGRKYFSFMVKLHNVPRNDLHYSCLVDILGRAGLIDEAYATIRSMPFVATVSMWGSFLTSCRKFGNLELAEIAAKNLFELEPNNAGNHILLSDIYAANKKWSEAARSRQVLRESLAKKVKGISWIEIKDKVHTFMAGETNHPQIIEIYKKLEALIDELRDLGYKTQIEHDFHDVEECKKEELLRHHSEKLALVFGLMALPPGVPIRIMKNLRICGDCHLFMKFASKFGEREIIVRDVNRFHHFSKGHCSCGEFW